MTPHLLTKIVWSGIALGLVFLPMIAGVAAAEKDKPQSPHRHVQQQPVQAQQHVQQQPQVQQHLPQQQPLRQAQPLQQPSQSHLGGNLPRTNFGQGNAGNPQSTRKIELPPGNRNHPLTQNPDGNPRNFNRRDGNANPGDGVIQRLNQNPGQPAPKRRNNENPPNNNQIPGGNKPNPGANNPNLGGQPGSRRDNDNKPGGAINRPNLGGNNPNLGGNSQRDLQRALNRNHDLKQGLKPVPHETAKRQENERNLIRNKEQAHQLLNNNPQLRSRIQTPDGKVDLSRLHLEHGNKDRIPAAIHKNGALPLPLDPKSDLAQRLHPHGNVKNLDDLNRHLNHFRDPNVLKQHPELARLNLQHASGNFQNHLAHHRYDHLAKSHVGKQLHLQQQFQLHQRGDVARQLNLQTALIQHGGWKNRYMGPIYSGFAGHSFSSWYCGPGYYPNYCWTPHWSPWVDWCWWNTCPIIYDPRPIYCRPIYYYDPCPNWVVYNYPVWQPLPVVACGTWIDVPTTLVDNTDLQLLAVRFVDNGHPDQELGTRYRVWFQNNSQDPITSPFNVLLMASNTPEAIADLPQAGVTVSSMEPGEMQVVDIRLPFAANRMNRVENHLTPFNFLHVLVDSHQQLADIDRTNNGAVLPRTDVLPVDPAAFAPDAAAAAPGAMVSIAGEGFGPEPGRLIVTVNGVETDATIYGWYDLGVQFELPNVAINQPTDAEVLVIRGDGAASNPVTVRIAPENQLEQAALPPAPLP